MADSVQNRKTYDFSSVGELDKDLRDQDSQRRIERVKRPLGIKTPLQLSADTDTIFQMHTVLIDQISDNLRNLIQTLLQLEEYEKLWKNLCRL